MSGSSTTSDADSPIRVVVTPSQSSYFAGEPFSITITFTNTRTPESIPLRSTHKRGAHSVSSAPLARPPTSPGTPRTSTPPPLRVNANGVGDRKIGITRKGFIGKGSLLPKGAEELPDVLEQSRKRLLAKARSLSVTVSPHEVELGPKIESAGYVRAYEDITPCKHLFCMRH